MFVGEMLSVCIDKKSKINNVISGLLKWEFDEKNVSYPIADGV